MFSDIQIFTSIATLICGFAQLPCSISDCHWQIVVYTAWFASVTHLTTLTAIRHYFSHINLKARSAKVVLMALTLSLLTVALLPTGNKFWPRNSSIPRDEYGVPATCYFAAISESSNYNSFSWPTSSFIVSTVVLWTSFVARIVKLYSRLSRVAKECLRDKLGNWLKKLIKWSLRPQRQARWPFRVIHDALTAQFILLRAVFDLYGSLL